MFNRSITLIFLTLLAAGCSNSDDFSIEGKTEAPGSSYIKLWKVEVNVPQLVDSARLGRSGAFRFRSVTAQPEFYQLGYSQSDFITLVVHPGDKIVADFRGSKLKDNYSVTGSVESEQVRQLEMRLADTRKILDSLSTIYETAAADPSMQEAAEKAETDIYNAIMEQRRYSIDFILGNMRSMASIMALYQRLNDETYVLYQSRDLQMMKLLSDTLTTLYPASKQVKAMSDDFQRELNSLNMRKIEEMAAATEPMEINPDLMNTEGKRVALSSLRGKYVLVTFWSTDSRDCITNNLQMKVYYSMYRKKGFEIYQINIDADEQKWQDAVKFDELPWISVREDDTASLRYTYIYNVQALPSNYLYDPDGEIVGVNLFGRTLEIKLEQLFGR